MRDGSLRTARESGQLPVVEYNAPASTMAYLAPETTMTLPATTPLVHAAAMEENGSSCYIVSALRDKNNDLIEAILCLEKEETVMQAVNSDIIETSEKRTLRISPVVDIPAELSKEMVEGFSAAMDEVIENFDKSDRISAVIDEFFDEPDKNLWSDEYVCGTWASEKGESKHFHGQHHESPLFRGSCG